MIRAEVRGSLRELLARDYAAAEREVSTAVNAAGLRVQGQLRVATRAALPRGGSGVINAWRLQAFPRGRPSLGAAVIVWTRAPDVIDALSKTQVVVPKRGKFLAWPTGFNAPQGRRGRRQFDWRGAGGSRMRFTPAEMIASKKAFIRRSKRNADVWIWCLPLMPGRGLVLPGGVPVATGKDRFRGGGRAERRRQILRQRFVPMFILMRAVALRKKLDLDAIASQAMADLDTQLNAALRRALG